MSADGMADVAHQVLMDQMTQLFRSPEIRADLDELSIDAVELVTAFVTQHADRLAPFIGAARGLDLLLPALLGWMLGWTVRSLAPVDQMPALERQVRQLCVAAGWSLDNVQRIERRSVS